MNEERSAIGARIRAERKLLGWNQIQLCQLAGVEQPYLSRLERGEKIGTPQTIGRIARALGVSVDFLLGGPRQASESSIPHDYPPGLRALTADANLRAMFSITDTEIANIARLEVGYRVNKEGYLQLIFAIRAVCGQGEPGLDPHP